MIPRRASLTGYTAAVLISVTQPHALAQNNAPTPKDLLQLIEQQTKLIEAQTVRIDSLEAEIAALRNAAPTSPILKVSPNQTEPVSTDNVSVDFQQSAARETAPAGNGDADIGRFPDDAIVKRGSFDRSIEIPGTELDMRIGGFAQVNVLYDFDGGASGNSFLASLLPFDAGRRSGSSINARVSRLNLDIRGDTTFGPFRTFLEGDFEGTRGNEATTNGDGFRLRHAYGQLGPVYAGQYWSLFSDVRSYPETLSLALPAGKSVVRQAGVRYRGQVSGNLSYAVSVENAESGFSGPLPAGASPIDTMPDLLANISYTTESTYLSLVGLVRRLSYETSHETNFSGDDALGWGLNLTGRIRTPWLHPRDNLTFGIAGGEGVGRYLIELGFNGLDGAYNPDTGRLRPVTVIAGQLGAQHWWTDKLRSTATFGLVEIESLALLERDDPRRLITASGNLVWSPLQETTFGVELIYGARETQVEESVDSIRLQLTGRYAF